MKLALVSAAAVAALVAASPSFATVTIQKVNGGAAISVPPTFNDGYGTDTVGTDTAVLYQFSLASAFTLSQASFTNVGGFALTSATLYAGTQSDVSTGSGLFGTKAANSANFTLTPAVVLQAGSYTLQLNGTASGNSTVGSSFRFSTAAVPEPATWGMMVLGFGAIGGALRTSRRKVVFA